jgi:hypothetical protein
MLSRILLIAALTVLGSCASVLPRPPPNSRHDIYQEYYGHMTTWKQIKAIDIHPNATFDGKPADDSIIFAYEAPDLGHETHKKMRRAVETFDQKERIKSTKVRRSNKCGVRFCANCYETGTWTYQYQLWGGVTSATNEAKEPVTNGQWYQQYKLWYQNSDGNWERFTKSYSDQTTSVYFGASMDETIDYTGPFGYNQVWEAYWGIVDACKGANPDSAGGALYSYSVGGSWSYHLTIDPQE